MRPNEGRQAHSAADGLAASGAAGNRTIRIAEGDSGLARGDRWLNHSDVSAGLLPHLRSPRGASEVHQLRCVSGQAIFSLPGGTGQERRGAKRSL